jgi:hypothetical protein
MLSLLIVFQLGVGWEISKIIGKDIYISLEGKTFRLSSSDNLQSQNNILVKTTRRSRIYLQKQSIYKPSKYHRVILDEESSAFFSKEITFHYGKMLFEISEGVDSEKFFINFEEANPFFVELLKGSLLILSADKGYIIYCSKCEGDIWKRIQGEEGEKAISQKPLISRKLFFITRDNIEDTIADDETFSLIQQLIERMNGKEFAKDIIYSDDTEDIPEPIPPEKKKFSTHTKGNEEIPSLRQMMLIESHCFQLLKKGIECRTKK